MNTEFKIVHNFQLPRKRRVGIESAYTSSFRKLKVGSAFLVEGGSIRDKGPGLYKAAERVGVKVSLRTDPEGKGVWAVRIRSPRTQPQETQSETVVDETKH